MVPSTANVPQIKTLTCSRTISLMIYIICMLNVTKDVNQEKLQVSEDSMYIWLFCQSIFLKSSSSIFVPKQETQNTFPDDKG